MKLILKIDINIISNENKNHTILCMPIDTRLNLLLKQSNYSPATAC